MWARWFAVFLVLAWSPAAPAQVSYPALTGRVVDAADVIPAETEAALDRKLAEHEGATSNQVVVATVPSLEGRDIESYANGLFRAWRLGQAEWDNGVLLLVAPNEREVRIEVGYGLEGVLTDALASGIIRNRILPRFRQGDLPAGIEAGVDAILAAVQGSYEATPERRLAVRDLLPLLPFVLWFIFIHFLGRRRRRRYRPWGYPIVYGGHGWGGSRGGGFGGGGFSGGGGSSGGGGASGRW